MQRVMRRQMCFCVAATASRQQMPAVRWPVEPETRFDDFEASDYADLTFDSRRTPAAEFFARFDALICAHFFFFFFFIC